MDLITVAGGFVVLTFIGALIKNDAVPWTIGLGRLLVRLASRLQTESERELSGVEAEYDHLADEVRAGRRATTSALAFSMSHAVRQMGRRSRRTLVSGAVGGLGTYRRRFALLYMPSAVAINAVLDPSRGGLILIGGGVGLVGGILDLVIEPGGSRRVLPRPRRR